MCVINRAQKTGREWPFSELDSFRLNFITTLRGASAIVPKYCESVNFVQHKRKLPEALPGGSRSEKKPELMNSVVPGGAATVSESTGCQVTNDRQNSC